MLENKWEPLVSIVIVVLNGKEFLQNVIDSITLQDYENKELIILDGGSNDGTVEVIQENEKDIKYWKSEKDRGIYHAWNKALLLAKGEYICFLGADDQYADARSLSAMVSKINVADKPDLISAKFSLMGNAGEVIATKGERWNWQRMKKWMIVAHPGLLHHKTLFERFGAFNESYKIAADYEFLLRLNKDVKALHLEQVAVLMGSNGVSNTNVLIVLGETLEIQLAHKEIKNLSAYYNYVIAILKSFLRYLF